MIAATHYRSLLSPPEQAVYRDIVAGLLANRRAIYIRQAQAQTETVRRIVNAVNLDHPELFYVDFWRFQLTSSPLPMGRLLEFRMLLDREPSMAVTHALDARAAALQRAVQGRRSREACYFLIAKKIASTTEYADTDNTFWNHTAAGPILHHRAVCEGIAKLYLFLCQRVDLPCAIVVGTANGVPHAWNMVELKGRKRFIDVTAELHTISCYTLVPSPLFRSEEALRCNGYDW